MALGYMSVHSNRRWGGGAFGAIRLDWRQSSEKEFFKSVEQLSQEKFRKFRAVYAMRRRLRVKTGTERIRGRISIVWLRTYTR